MTYDFEREKAIEESLEHQGDPPRREDPVRIYRIWQCAGNHITDDLIKTGIVGYQPATQEADRLQKIYDQEHPNLTTWTKDLFIVELECEGGRPVQTRYGKNRGRRRQ